MYAVIAMAMVWVKDRNISPGVLLLAQFALPTIGFYLLQKERGVVPGGSLVLIAPMLVAAGIILGPSKNKNQHTKPKSHKIYRYLQTAFCVIFILSILHFGLAGIPALSKDIETARFNFGASGLAGFPSRAVQYALPALALISLATVTQLTRKITILILMLYVLTQLAMGFKGALLEVLFLMVIAYLIRVGKPTVKHMALLLVGLLGALLYVEVIRSLYATSTTGVNALEYIVERSTKQAIESGYLALFYGPDFAAGSSAFLSDLQQLLKRYTGNSDSGDYTFDMLMSSIVTGTPLGAGNFIVPVTVGGPVYLLFSMPLALAVIALIAIGWTWAWSIHAIRRLDNIIVVVIAALLIAGTRMFLLNGNGAYLLINLTFTAVLLILCEVFNRLIKLHKTGWSQSPTSGRKLEVFNTQP